jgi:hypothetical protein
MKSPGKEENKLISSISNKPKNPLRKYQSEEDDKINNRTESHNTDRISSDKNVE